MSSPKISVIVPVYNAEKYIKKCIESILKQIYVDFEIVIVDDGSKDNSIKIVEESFNDNRIRIVHKHNAGLPQARKTGFQNSKGEYIFFVDADDWIEEDTLLGMYAAVVDTDADIICCGLTFDSLAGQILKRQTIKKSIMLNSTESIRYIHTNRGVYMYMWNKLFKREIISEFDFPEGNFIGEDYYTLMNILRNDCKVIHIPNIYYHYVQRVGSMLNSGFDDRHKLAYKNYDIQLKNLCKRYPKLSNDIISYHYLEKMVIINSMIRNSKYDYFLMKEIILFMKKNLMVFLSSKMKVKFRCASLLMLYMFPIYKVMYVKSIKDSY